MDDIFEIVNSVNQLSVDLSPLDMAKRFIETLTGDASSRVNLKLPSDRARDAGAPEICGRIEDLWPRVEGFQAEGRACFIFMNEVAEGRVQFINRAHIVRVRALAVDFDGELPASYHLAPTMIVYSSVKGGRQRGQVWWVLDDALPLDQFRQAQQRLIEFYGADPKHGVDTSVHDLTRVLRLPGTLHLKREPSLVTLESIGPRYAAAKVLAGLPELLPRANLSPPGHVRGQCEGCERVNTAAEVIEVLRSISPECPYERWRNVIFGLSNTKIRPQAKTWTSYYDQTDTRQLASAWSKGDVSTDWIEPEQYDETTEDVIDTLFATRPADGTWPITFGTLMKYADEERVARGGAPLCYHPSNEKPSDVFQPIIDKVTVEGRDWPDLAAALLEGNQEQKLPQLTRGMMPDALLDYAFDEANQRGVTPDMLAMPMLGASAACIHDNYMLQHTPITSFIQSARLWIMTIAPPSSGKTHTFNAAMEPIREIEGRFDREYLAAHRQWENNCEKKKKLGAAANDGLAVFAADLEAEEPWPKRLYASDFTMEVMFAILAKNNGGILLAHDEIMNLFGGIDTYRVNGGKDRPLFIDAYNGGPKKVDRVGTGKRMTNYSVPNWSFSIAGGVQADRLAEEIKDRNLTNDGFFQRFMVYQCQTLVKVNRYEERPVNHAAKGRYENALKRLIGLPIPTRSILQVTPEGRAIVLQTLAVIDAVADGDSPIRAFKERAGKWRGELARILLTFHAIEQVDLGETSLSNSVVPESVAKMAHKFFTEYLIPQEELVYLKYFGGSVSTEAIAVKVADKIKQRGPAPYITAREVLNCCKFLGDKGNVLAIMGQLEEWSAVGPLEITTSRENGSGTKINRWPINPALFRGM